MAIELHNVWMMETDEDGNGLIMHMRPQDWGSPKWHYKAVTLEVEIDGKQYRNTAHIWLEGVYPDYDLMQTDWFRELVFTVQYPGTNPKLCGREFLQEEDFWQDSWGEMPKHLNEEEDDWQPYYGG